jgi:hypothetical protein
MGEACAEVWANLGLSCFYAGQYDLCFNCFERALGQADDALLPDIWYNIGQVSRLLQQLGHMCCSSWGTCVAAAGAHVLQQLGHMCCSSTCDPAASGHQGARQHPNNALAWFFRSKSLLLLLLVHQQLVLILLLLVLMLVIVTARWP